MPFVFGDWHLIAFIGSWLASLIMLSGLSAVKPHWRHLNSMPISFYTMVIGHFGMAVFIFGVTFNSLYSQERSLSMEPNDTAHLAGFSFTFNGIKEYEQENYIVREGLFTVTKNNQPFKMEAPQKRFYPVQQNTTTEVAISPGVFYDVYVALGEPIDKAKQRWSLRFHYNIMINWIWAGALIIALAALLGILDKRYHLRKSNNNV